MLLLLLLVAYYSCGCRAKMLRIVTSEELMC